MAVSMSLTLVTGITGIICSVHTRLWSVGTSAMRSRTSPGDSTPISERILPASWPIQAVSMTPGLFGAPISLKITRSMRRSSCSFNR